MTFKAISAGKANSLFWLGRYTERVYLELHLLRRYYDKMIDGKPEEYAEYYKYLDVANPYEDERSFRLGFLYDEKNPCSVYSSMISANDNAILLRDEIISETLSYIQMSLVLLKENKEKEIENVTNLQNVTDWLLAFWGSVDERIFDDRVANFMKSGKMVELLDILARFQYPFFRLREVFDRLLKCADIEKGMFDKHLLAQMDEMLTEKEFRISEPEYRYKFLKYLNQLVLV